MQSFCRAPCSSSSTRAKCSPPCRHVMLHVGHLRARWALLSMHGNSSSMFHEVKHQAIISHGFQQIHKPDWDRRIEQGNIDDDDDDDGDHTHKKGYLGSHLAQQRLHEARIGHVAQRTAVLGQLLWRFAPLHHNSCLGFSARRSHHSKLHAKDRKVRPSSSSRVSPLRGKFCSSLSLSLSFSLSLCLCLSRSLPIQFLLSAGKRELRADVKPEFLNRELNSLRSSSNLNNQTGPLNISEFFL